VLDSGATDHMMKNKNLLINYKSYEGKQIVIVANEKKWKFWELDQLIFFQELFQMSCI
jgi:hypothetical protein